MRAFKKLVVVALSGSLVFSSLGIFENKANAKNGQVYPKPQMKVQINGETLSMTDKPVIVNGRVLLPMREMYESLDAKVSWNKSKLEAGAEIAGRDIDMTIGNSRATVDGQTVTLDSPPILYKYRTYVPFRFLAESIGGKITYNQQKQEITLNVDLEDTDTPPVEEPKPEPIPPVTNPHILHVNGKRIVMEHAAIERNYRMHIPVSYFPKAIDDSFEMVAEDNTNKHELVIGGMSLQFTNGSSIAMVDGLEVDMGSTAFKVGDQMYVSLSFLVNTLGGNLRYLRESRSIYVYVNQFLFSTNFLEKEQTVVPRPTPVPTAQLEGNRSLLISDNPETLTTSVIPYEESVLAKQDVNTSNMEEKHRVFGWHFNKLGRDIKLGITVQNTSSTRSIVIKDSHGYMKRSSNSWINYDVGLPIADAMLSGKLNSSVPDDIVVAPGQSVTIWEASLLENYIIGFVEDMTIAAGDGYGNSSYTIRTALGKPETILSNILTTELPANYLAAHPRGAWPSSTVAATLPIYQVGSPQVGYNLSNGSTDNLMKAENSIGGMTQTVSNPGHFGVIYRVTIPVQNTTGEAKAIKVKLVGRGGNYSGSVKVNGQVKLVPTLKPATEQVTIHEEVITDYQKNIVIDLVHSGGSALPVGIYIES